MRRHSSLGATYEFGLPVYMGGKTNIDVPVEKMSADAVGMAMPLVQAQVGAMIPGIVSSTVQGVQMYLPSIVESAVDVAIPAIAERAAPQIVEKSWPSLRWKVVQATTLTALAIGAVGLIGIALYSRSKSKV